VQEGSLRVMAFSDQANIEEEEEGCAADNPQGFTEE
jgi:hypothetical protein